MVQVVASLMHQAFRRTDMHNSTELSVASYERISAQEHFQLANIPGSLRQIIPEWRDEGTTIFFVTFPGEAELRARFRVADARVVAAGASRFPTAGACVAPDLSFLPGGAVRAPNRFRNRSPAAIS